MTKILSGILTIPMFVFGKDTLRCFQQLKIEIIIIKINNKFV
jgi:hypothetical protein